MASGAVRAFLRQAFGADLVTRETLRRDAVDLFVAGTESINLTGLGATLNERFGATVTLNHTQDGHGSQLVVRVPLNHNRGSCCCRTGCWWLQLVVVCVLLALTFVSRPNVAPTPVAPAAPVSGGEARPVPSAALAEEVLPRSSGLDVAGAHKVALTAAQQGIPFARDDAVPVHARGFALGGY